MIWVGMIIFYNCARPWISTYIIPRWLNKAFRKQLLLKIYKSYVQSKLDYGLSIWECTTEGNLGVYKELVRLDYT